MRALIVLATLLPLAACDVGEPLAPDFEEELTELGGCGDLIAYAVNDDDTLMLDFRVDGLVEEATTAGEETTTVFELPDPEVTLVVEEGTKVSDAMCDDVIENGGPQVDATWTAISGTATVTVRPGASLDEALSDVLLEDVVFESETGEQVTLEELSWSDLSVGWFAG